ncbi:hypothetical protein AB3S75_013314 [Citrus x aurantiifolia]
MPRVAPRASGPANLRSTNFNDLIDFIERKEAVLDRTALLVVACEGNWEFMEELVNVMDANDLGMVDELGCTALHYAAVGGSIKACKALVRKKRALTQTLSNRGWTPLLSAAHCAPNDKDIVYYLSSVTTNEPPGRPFTGALAGMLAYALAAGGFHDIILYLSERHLNLCTAEDDVGHNILDALVLKPQDFQMPGIKQVQDAKLTHKLALELAKHVFKAFSNVYDVENYASFLSFMM